MAARKDHTRSYYQPYHPCPWQAIKWRIVKEAVVNRGWVKDIRGALTLKQQWNISNYVTCYKMSPSRMDFNASTLRNRRGQDYI